MKKFCRQGWVVVAALGLSACGGKDKEAEPKASVTAASDIVALRAENRSGYAKLDAKSAGLFGEIFGGTDSTSVASYLDSRAKYFVDKDDPEVLVEGTPISRIVGDDDQDSGSIQVGAMNIGAVLWLESEVNRRPYTLEVHGNASTMTDSRNGLVVLGPGYRRDYPVAVRQGRFPVVDVRDDAEVPDVFRHAFRSGGTGLEGSRERYQNRIGLGTMGCGK
jgi:hypothetical protein